MTKKIALVFPGQGSQKVGMGKNFYDNFLEAKEVFQEVDEVLKQNLAQLIFSGEQAELTKTENAQPALMAVSLAMVKVLNKLSGKNIVDYTAYVAGHSLGEYSALAAADALTIKDCAALLQVRGTAMRDAGNKTSGAMAAVIGVDTVTAQKITEQAAQGDICQIANDNSIGQIVISGHKSAIHRAVTIGKELGAKKVIPLPVSGAFHSELVAEAAAKVEAKLAEIELTSPTVPVISNVTAAAVSETSEIKNLLVKQVTSAVRFRESVENLKKLGVTDIIEIGAGNVLTGLVKRIDPEITLANIREPEELETFIKDYL